MTRSSAVPTPRTSARLALVALCLGFFVILLDVTVVNVALEAIRADLGGGIADQQWIVAGYTVALAAGMLTAGRWATGSARAASACWGWRRSRSHLSGARPHLECPR